MISSQERRAAAALLIKRLSTARRIPRSCLHGMRNVRALEKMFRKVVLVILRVGVEGRPLAEPLRSLRSARHASSLTASRGSPPAACPGLGFDRYCDGRLGATLMQRISGKQCFIGWWENSQCFIIASSAAIVVGLRARRIKYGKSLLIQSMLNQSIQMQSLIVWCVFLLQKHFTAKPRRNIHNYDHLSNPKPGHTTGGAAHGCAAGRGGAWQDGTPTVGPPGRQPSLLPSRVSKTTVPNPVAPKVYFFRGGNDLLFLEAKL